MAAAPAFSALGLGGQANGLPIDIMAIPQCAMPHSGSCSRTLANDSFAGSNPKEWKRAMARLKSFCAAALHETGKLTSPSGWGGAPRSAPCSLCCALAPDVKKPSAITNLHTTAFVIVIISSLINSPFVERTLFLLDRWPSVPGQNAAARPAQRKAGAISSMRFLAAGLRLSSVARTRSWVMAEPRYVQRFA